MTTIWETTIASGNPAHDHQQLGQIKAQYEAQGHIVQVQPMPTGGFHVRVVRAEPQMQQSPYGQPPPQAYGQPPPQQQQFGQPPPQQGYSAPPMPQYGQPPMQQQQAQQQQQQHYGQPPPYGQAPAQAPFGPGFAAAGAGAFAYAGGPSGPESHAHAGHDAGIAPLGAQRVRYLRKVYGLLFISAILAIAGGMVTVSPLLGTETFPLDGGKTVEVPLIVALMLENPALEYGAFALLFVGVLGASFVSKIRGLNYAALFAVSILMGVEMAPMAFVAQVLAGLGETLSANPVRDTFGMVGAIFFGLTGYVFVTRKDFSYLGATLSMGFMVVFAGCILAFVLDSEPFSLAIASVGALLSIGFLLYQTSYIFRNSDMDDPVDDALGLIVQLRNLFMFLLRIFMSRR